MRTVADALEHARIAIVEASRYIHERGLTHGSTGNVSVRVGEDLLVTPTGKSLRSLSPSDLALVGLDGTVRSEAKPSKEAVLHAAVYRARPEATAVVHTHSPYSTAVSCLAGIDEADALPPLTAYYAMRVGRLPVLPFYPPGDAGMAAHAGRVAGDAHAMLLRNHGPIVASASLDNAIDVLEELEQTARLFLLLDGREILPVDEDAARRLFDSTRN